MLSLAGVSVALIRAFHARSKRPIDQGAEGQNSLSADDPPAHAGALHALCHQGLCWQPRPRLSRWRCLSFRAW